MTALSRPWPVVFVTMCATVIVSVRATHGVRVGQCNASSFPHGLTGIECWGLSPVPYDKMGHPVTSADQCRDTCCSDLSCSLWNFNASAAGAARGNVNGVTAVPPCWISRQPRFPATCRPVAGWVGGGGRGEPPPPPPPPPGAPKNLLLPTQPTNSTALPYQFDPVAATSPSGAVIAADSLSLLRSDGKGQPLTRWFPVSGEIHLARVPASQWREQLLRMKAGGLDMIAVYVFWIHHEERRGTFTFDGRRNVTQFLAIAQEVGLHVLMRVGPWDHGECRNGGHPDWVLDACTPLRSTNPNYLGCVKPFYAELAKQMAGMFWKDGGPVVAVQVDNETTDWKYLLALKQLALAAGIAPAFFTKTGWPAPAPGYPADYPMMPFFGGYADNFWSNAMSPNADLAQYTMRSNPSAAQRQTYAAGRHDRLGDWNVPQGYPWLDVEIGGGMAAAYNHRVHMDADDMPAMHLCDVASGVNMLGYYMYHGGNNPHSLMHATDRDDPSTTLQESSFQPAGAANPMPSISYDFFAPLGEFGQLRSHYHSMRRMHNMVIGWGPALAATSTTTPASNPSYSDNTTTRWVVRSDGLGAAFLFVNNYQRLTDVSPKPMVRFNLTWGRAGSIQVPALNSKHLTIPSGSWFVLPLRTPLACGGGITLAWATAQLVAQVEGVVFLQELAGISAELGFDGATAAQVAAHGSAAATEEGGFIVVRGLTPGMSSAATVACPGADSKVDIVVLPASVADSVYVADLAGTRRVVVAPGAATVMTQDKALYLRTEFGGQAHATASVTVSIYPAVARLEVAGQPAFQPSSNGVFAAFRVATRVPSVAVPTLSLVSAAGPARVIPLARSHKAQEPNMTDWEGAAHYTVTVSLAGGLANTTELLLAVDYIGDAARVYYKDRCLTDNWFSGYNGQGQLEVGLSYLAAENPGLVTDGAVLDLYVLPLQRSALESNVFLQPSLWPDFGGNSTALAVDAIRAIGYEHTDLVVTP